jgi:hypothetical protein
VILASYRCTGPSTDILPSTSPPTPYYLTSLLLALGLAVGRRLGRHRGTGLVEDVEIGALVRDLRGRHSKQHAGRRRGCRSEPKDEALALGVGLALLLAVSGGGDASGRGDCLHVAVGVGVGVGVLVVAATAAASIGGRWCLVAHLGSGEHGVGCSSREESGESDDGGEGLHFEWWIELIKKLENASRDVEGVVSSWSE